MEDIEIARKYVEFYDSRTKEGKSVELSFTSFKNLMRAKKCAYTGVKLTDKEPGKQRASDRTIDRIDNSNGYVKGNVVAVCFSANNFKSRLENPNSLLTPYMLMKIIKMFK